MPKIKLAKVTIGLDVTDAHIGRLVYGNGYIGYSKAYTGRYGRRFVYIHIKGLKSTRKFLTPRARFLYQMHHGIKLGKNEHVDHIDNDCTNDVIENLQVLSPEENINKLYEDMKSKYGLEWATTCVNKLRRRIKGKSK